MTPERRTLAGLFQWPKDGIRVTSTVWCSVVGILSALGSSGDASHAGNEDRVYSLSTSNRPGGWHPSMHARHCPRGSSFFMGNYPKNALFVAPTAATLRRTHRQGVLGSFRYPRAGSDERHPFRQFSRIIRKLL